MKFAFAFLSAVSAEMAATGRPAWVFPAVVAAFAALDEIVNPPARRKSR